MYKKVGVSPEDVWKCYKFATDMRGNHNNDLIMGRTDEQIFIDDLRGKLAEIVVKRYLEKKYRNEHRVGDLDFEVYPLGQWDKDDVVVDGNIHVSVKSSGIRSSYLMIEKDRFDDNGNYRYQNDNNEPIIINEYAFVNVYMEGEEEERDNAVPRIRFMDYITTEKQDFMRRFLRINGNEWTPEARKFYCHLRGFIPHEEFWRMKSVAQRGIRAIKSNFDSISSGQQVPVDPGFVENDKRWLQRDNYILSVQNFNETLNL
ncbi:hypothetical protein [Butyrivibrio sp. NC2002]|uniref:hypothetical protein n=1 Tax=Butyrivibrio sp. NC2002 TaxID=1410610 RepID=UPI000566FED6|nr:hypothetical protein [Butyrivibrio sp. NC2002]